MPHTTKGRLGDSVFLHVTIEPALVLGCTWRALWFGSAVRGVWHVAVSISEVTQGALVRTTGQCANTTP